MRMKEKLKLYQIISSIYCRALAKWTFAAVLTGVFSGCVGTLFHVGVEYATELRAAHFSLVFCLPLAGLAIVALYRLFRSEGLSTDSVIEEVQAGRGVPLGLMPAIFFSTLLTHLCGGSVGREGAALQLGGAIGYQTGRLLRLDDSDMRTMTTIGMAALFSALFGTPVAASVFALSVINVGRIYYAGLFPSLTAAITAYGVSLAFGVAPTRFTTVVPVHSVGMFVRVTALSALCAFVSVLFCEGIHLAGHLMRERIPNPWLRAAAGGAAVTALTLLFGTDYNGAGMNVIATAVEQGKAVPEAFALKLLFTAITLAAGFKGGEVVPSFFVGATFGCVMGPLLGVPAPFAAAVGMIAVFCGAVNCPLASTFLAVEIFGAEGLLYFAAACSLSFVLSGYSGIYSSQRILNDKLKSKYIDVHTNAHHAGKDPGAR